MVCGLTSECENEYVGLCMHVYCVCVHGFDDITNF